MKPKRAIVAWLVIGTAVNAFSTLAVPDGVPGGSWWTGELITLGVLAALGGCVWTLAWATDAR